MRSVLVLVLTLLLLVPLGGAFAPRPASRPNDWSEVVGDLQARIVLIEQAPSNGTRMLMPYLEIRNVGGSAAPIRVRCGSGHVRFELVDADGKVVRDGVSLPRSGPHADPGTVILPHDSSMRIGMHCSNWGVPRDAAAMIATDSGAWVLSDAESGRVYLRATLTGKPLAPDTISAWEGTLQTPPWKVNWGK